MVVSGIANYKLSRLHYVQATAEEPKIEVFSRRANRVLEGDIMETPITFYLKYGTYIGTSRLGRPRNA